MNKKILVKTLLTTSTVGALGGGIASSIVLTSCETKTKDKPSLQLTLLSDVSRPIDTDMKVEFLYETSIVAKFDHNNLKLVGEGFTSFDFDHYTKTCWVTLLTSAGLGNHSFYLQYDNIKSNPLTVGFSNSEKSLEINAAQTITPNGVELNISGSYETFNIDSPTIELVDSASSIFTPLEVDYYKGTFTTSLPANTPIGTYDLQLVAKSGVGDVLSNPISFTVGPFAASNGSNWSGRTSGTVKVVPNEEDMTATIISDGGYTAKYLIIPEYVFDDGKFYTVTSIGERAFDNDNLTGTLTLPKSLTSIGDYAFDGCENLIGTLTIPDGVTSIGNHAFSGCRSFTGHLTIPDGVTNIGNYAFSGCYGLTGHLIIPNGVTSIGEHTFSGCSGFTGILDIPDSVTSIGEKAFEGCSGFTGNLTIPNSVTSIGNNAFMGCSGFTGELIIHSKVGTIGDYAFSSCDGLTGSLIIPSGVTSIGKYAFSNCTGFAGRLTIPRTVASIGDYAFINCSKFTVLSLTNFSAQPNWAGTNIFIGWNSTSGSVSVSGNWNKTNALTYLKNKGLPPAWDIS